MAVLTPLTPYTTTTVVIAQETATPLPSDLSHQPIPVAAIVGGIIGGASLAVLVTTGWVCWGKSLKRKQLKERLEIESQLQTLRNTHHNATISQRSQNLSGLHLSPSVQIPEPKIRFANSGDATATESIPTSKRLLDPTKSTKPVRLRRLKPPSKQSNSYQENATPTGRQRATSLPGTVANKSSAPSLASAYTTASDEMDPAELGNGVGTSLQRFLIKNNWQANGTSSFELQRQSVSTYETATSRIIDDV
ncbi:hypothetical protein F5887DRAFT_1210947 [Amanita rubescens]|nr:hypothetical protein F5887DRAFT_1210947 [Amanita rubescens]